MKIEKIELRHIKMELVSPFTTSMGTEYDEEHIIIRIDGEGLTGWGECVAEATPFYSYETVTTAWHILQENYINNAATIIALQWLQMNYPRLQEKWQ